MLADYFPQIETVEIRLDEEFTFVGLSQFDQFVSNYTFDPNLEEIDYSEEEKTEETVYVYGVRKSAVFLIGPQGKARDFQTNDSVEDSTGGGNVILMIRLPTANEIKEIKANIKRIFPGLTDKQINKLMFEIAGNKDARNLLLNIGEIKAPVWNGSIYQTSMTAAQRDTINQALTKLNTKTSNYAKGLFATAIASGKVKIVN